MLLAACTPVTARPDFRPFPQATTVLLVTRPQLVIPYLKTLMAAESLGVKRASPPDGYLEGHWYDTGTRRSIHSDAGVSDLARTVKIRCWADPYVPGETMLTLEVVYRPRYDPSRLERELEIQDRAQGHHHHHGEAADSGEHEHGHHDDDEDHAH